MIIVRTVSLPNSVRGFVKEDPDGNYNVYVRANLSDEEKLKTVLHEVRHVRLRHLEDDTKTVHEKEAEVDLRED